MQNKNHHLAVGLKAYNERRKEKRTIVIIIIKEMPPMSITPSVFCDLCAQDFSHTSIIAPL